jgi:hypothetical protein
MNVTVKEKFTLKLHSIRTKATRPDKDASLYFRRLAQDRVRHWNFVNRTTDHEIT